MAKRIEKQGLLIDRDQSVTLRFDGKPIPALAGDNVASALLANDRVLIGRSFKYHRPRGLVGSGAEEPNALIGSGQGTRFEPNNRATMTTVKDGDVAISQNRFPSLAFDLSAINNMLARMFPAGFYYKTFMAPRAAWKSLYEPVIRHSAGLGKGTEPGDPDRYEHFYAFYDLVVAGGGISGIIAARNAANAGLRVLLAEQSCHWGGRVLVDQAHIDGKASTDWVHEQIEALGDMANVTLRLNMQISGSYDHGYLLANEQCENGPRNRLWRIRSKHLIAATGALERPLAFAGNDTPGVMLASAVRDFAQLWGVVAGERVFIVTNNDDAYRTALTLLDAGVEIVGIAEAGQNANTPLVQEVEARGVKIHRGVGIAKVKGGKRVKSVALCELTGDGTVLETVECDCVAMSGGWSPVVHLWSHCGGKLNWDEKAVHFAPDPQRPPLGADGQAMVTCVGTAAGEIYADQSVQHANRISQDVVTNLGGQVEGHAPHIIAPEEAPVQPVWMMPFQAPYKLRAKAFLDFQNDVKVADVQLAAQEGFQSVEHAKRYTTLGMATDQGKTSNINGLAVLAQSLNSAIPAVGTTTFRPPYTPIPMGVIAGHHTGELFKPLRKTVIHDWHESQNLKWEPVGDWRRPYTYFQGDEDAHAAVKREVRNTRENVGLLDASTLGKILVKGPDAGKFLDLIYTNMMSTLKIGYCRYGLMLNENGFVHDDGVVARIDEDQYICHTTSGGSDRVHAMMEEWLQTEWWDLKAYTTNLTEQYAQIAVVGPLARRVLEDLGGMDVSAEALPFMQFRDGVLGGFDARVYRISFSGELSYEIAVRADQGRAFWDAVLAAGQKHNMMPYGTEALHVMRAEKGFIMVGDETDGTVTPLDLNMNWIISKKKEDFLGKRGLERPLFHSDQRWKLVGLLTKDPDIVLPHAVQALDGEQVLGYVTSTYYSPTMDRSIAMALIQGGMDREGEILEFKAYDGRTIAAKVVDPVFYDKEGAKQNVI